MQSRLLSGAIRGPLFGRVLALAALSAVASPMQAQDNGDSAAASSETDLEPVMVSATRTETPVSELTRSVSVVTREEIEKQAQLDSSINDIISKTVPGISPSTEAMSNFGQTLRGRKFLTLIDGVPQTMTLRDGRRAVNAIDSDAIERIEVVRGGTAAYGFGATGGLLNLITRRPEEGEFSAHSEVGLKGAATRPDDESLGWQTRHRVSGHEGNVDYLVGGAARQRGSYFDAEGDRIPPDPLGAQGGLPQTEQYNVLGKTGVESDDGNQRLEFMVNHFQMAQDSDWAGLATGGDAETNQKSEPTRGNINVKDPATENTQASLKYDHRDLAGQHLKAQLYHGDLLTRFAKFPGAIQRQYESEKTGARLTMDSPVALGNGGFNVIWGGDYLNDETRSKGLDGDVGTPAMDQDAFAGFVELEVPVGDRAMVRGGVRHEMIDLDVGRGFNTNGQTVQGATLDFDETLYNLSGVVFLRDNMELFTGYSEGFSLSDFGRAVRESTATDAAELKSEAQTVDNYEMGLRGRGPNWKGSIAAFYSTSEKGSSFNTNLELQKRPEKIRGVELEGSVKSSKRSRLGGTVTWMEGEVDLDDDGSFEEELPSSRVPPTKVTAFAEYRINAKWKMRVQGLYSGDRNPDSSQFYGEEVDSYTLLDVQSTFQLPRGTLQLSVDNITNEQYFPVINQAADTGYSHAAGPGARVAASYSIDW